MSGKFVWRLQVVHHDVWDYDVAAQQRFSPPVWVGIVDTASILDEEKDLQLVISPWEPGKYLRPESDEQEARRDVMHRAIGQPGFAGFPPPAERFVREGDARIHMHSLGGLIHADHRSPTLDYDMVPRTTMVVNTCSCDYARQTHPDRYGNSKAAKEAALPIESRTAGAECAEDLTFHPKQRCGADGRLLMQLNVNAVRQWEARASDSNGVSFR